MVREYDDLYRRVVNEIDVEDRIDDDLIGIVRILGLDFHEFVPNYKRNGFFLEENPFLKLISVSNCRVSRLGTYHPTTVFESRCH